MRHIVYLLLFVLLGCESKKQLTEQPFIGNDSILSEIASDSEDVVSIQKLLNTVPSEKSALDDSAVFMQNLFDVVPSGESAVDNDDVLEELDSGDANQEAHPISCLEMEVITKEVSEKLYSAGICVVEEESINLTCIAKYKYNRCLKPVARKMETSVVTCTQQGRSDVQFSVTRNDYYVSNYLSLNPRYTGYYNDYYKKLSCDVIDNRDNQPLVYAMGPLTSQFDKRECQSKWDRIKSQNSYRCSDDRYVTLFHSGRLGAKLKIKLKSGQNASIRRNRCIKVPVNELYHASITVGKEEICNPITEDVNKSCWTFFYSEGEGSGVGKDYGYYINKLSSGVLGSPPYWYHYTFVPLHTQRMLDCKEVNDELR